MAAAPFGRTYPRAPVIVTLEHMTSLAHQLEMAERLSAITQKVGFALWQIQILEGVAAKYFVLLTQAQKGMGLAAGNALIDKAKSKTFGSTIHQIGKAGLLSSVLEKRFATLLEERNWLVHRSREDSRSVIHGDKIAKALIGRLDAMADEATSLLKEIGLLVEKFVRQHGVSAEYIDKVSKELLEQWSNADAL